MKNKRASTAILCLLTISGLFCDPVWASNINNGEEEYCQTEILNLFGEINREQTITINGVKNPLYCTFVNQDDALAKLRKLASGILSEISSLYGLGEINDNNWEYYQYAALNLPKTSKYYSEDNLQREILADFFDIYENVKANNEILEQFSGYERKQSISQEKLYEAGLLLPSYTTLAERSNRQVETQNHLMVSLPNVDAAISYAKKYAVNANKSGYGEARGGIKNSVMDCTNFASQILEASGVKQVIYNVDTKGWWHKKNGDKHTYSASWINSNTFARYMGVRYTATNHKYFSRNIKKGDFITYDKTYDGSWDHIGFVTDRKDIEICYEKGEFYNYKVAQHTENYHKWADESNWPIKGKKYGRVRR
jgi:hypothetical protein